MLVRGRDFSVGSFRVSALLGAGLTFLSVGILLRAKQDLAGNLTMSPTPVVDGRLVERGLYGIIRHPMYLGVLLLMFGVALVLGSWFSLVVALALIPFFFAKARHEEALLATRYENYREYTQRVRSRFVPWVF